LLRRLLMWPPVVVEAAGWSDGVSGAET